MSANADRFAVVLQPRGWRFNAAADVSLLDAARKAGYALPSSCRNGTCRTCLCRLLDGRVSYRIEWPGLSAEEKRDGFILPCVAHAETDLVLQVRAITVLNPPPDLDAAPA